LFWVCEKKKERFFEPSQKAVTFNEEAQNQRIENLSRVKKILLKEGMAEDKIQFKISDCDGESRISEKILEELKSARYDTVFVAKHDVTRVQEFLFGDTTINLVRKSPVPVFVARGQPDKEVER
jgi:nucleotide-binding universal stress UspA family protein